MKAAGLAELPPDWTPSFIAIAAGCHRALDRDATVRRELQRALRALQPCPDGLLVRSSATDEGLDRRGALDSIRSGSSVDEVARAVKQIAAEVPRGRRASLAFVVQQWKPDAARGHLSNERRVSQDSRSWLCEAELPVAAEDRAFRLRVDSDVEPAEGPECRSLDELSRTLRAVAQRHRHQRVHIEWVWDGSRVWLVQLDHDSTPEGDPPGAAWTRPPWSDVEGDLRLFTAIPPHQSAFPKVNHVRLFRDLGLPHGDVWVLSGRGVIEGLAQGSITDELRSDLAALIEQPLVVRTDLRAETARPEVLSRRTDTCLTRRQLESFLITTAQAFVEAGNDADDLAFLAHRFLLGRAGAFSFAQPGDAQVLIDATWGIPDSLLFHPHDSYRVHLESGKTERYLRCKTDYIDVDARGAWKSRSSGQPWDWRSTLSQSQAVSIAQMTARIADAVGEPVEVMFFITGRPEAPVLPWFYRATERVISDLDPAPGFYVGEKVAISTLHDIEAVDRRLRSTSQRIRLTLTLRPSIDLLRSRPFILAVAELAMRRSLPVELEGSQLSHAYYLLDDAGVAVRCINPWRRPERRQTFGKLVRDLVPVRIERQGELASIYHAGRQELVDLLKAKVVEEALEYYWEADASSLVDELGDLLELLRASAEVNGASFNDVERAANEKRKERGGFESGVVLVETRATGVGGRTGTATRPLLSEPDLRARPRPFSARRRVVRLPGRRLQLPLVPPTSWARDTAHTLSLDADEEVTITYGKDAISLHVRSRAADRIENQLQLPGLDDPAQR